MVTSPVMSADLGPPEPTEDGNPQISSQRRDLGSWGTALSIGVYALLALAVFWDIWFTHPTSVTTLGGDQFNAMWYLNWFSFALTHGINPLHPTFMNYPYGVNAMMDGSTPLLGYGFAPVTWLFGPIATYNLVMTLGMAGSATAMYFLLRRLTEWRFAAFIGGLLYGFSPYEMAQAPSHIFLSFIVFPPLIFLVLHNLVVRQKGRPWCQGVLLGLLLVAQALVSTEILATTLIIGAIAVVAVVITGHASVRDHLRFAALGIAWAALVSVVLLAYPLWYATHGPEHVTGPIQLVPQGYRADLLGPIIPDSSVLLAPSHLANIAQNFASSTIENGSYLGITLLTVMAVGVVVLRRNKVVQVAAITGCAAFVLSLGARLAVHSKPQVALTGGAAGLIPLPETWLAKIPLLDNLAPARISLYTVLFASVILAVILDRLRLSILAGNSLRWVRDRVGRFTPPFCCGALAVFALFPLMPKLPYDNIGPIQTPPYFTSSAFGRVTQGSAAIEYPMAFSGDMDAVAFQMLTGPRFKMPGGTFIAPEGSSGPIDWNPTTGYTEDTPLTLAMIDLYAGTAPPMTTAQRAVLRAQLRTWNIQTIIAFPKGADPAKAVAWFTWLMGTGPMRQSQAFIWYHVQQSLGP